MEKLISYVGSNKFNKYSVAYTFLSDSVDFNIKEDTEILLYDSPRVSDSFGKNIIHFDTRHEAVSFMNKELSLRYHIRLVRKHSIE